MEKTNTSRSQTLSCPAWQKITFFQNLDTNLIRDLLEKSTVQATKNRQIILTQDTPADCFLFVTEGLFRLYRTNAKDQRVIMDFVGPGGMVAGLLMAQSEINYPITCQSVGPGQILKIPKETYQKYWISNPLVMARVQSANLERMQALHETRELQKYPLDEKLIHILNRLSPAEDPQIHLRISKTDLADMAGAAVESVIRVFSAWEKRGWVQVNDEGVQLISKKDLLKGTGT